MIFAVPSWGWLSISSTRLNPSDSQRAAALQICSKGPALILRALGEGTCGLHGGHHGRSPLVDLFGGVRVMRPLMGRFKSQIWYRKVNAGRIKYW
jgi:hypothetical protein